MLIGKLTRLIRWRFPQMVLVEGRSMEPGLPDGSWVLMVPTPGRLPRLGQVVVAEHPHRPGFELVKRVGAVSRSRRLLWLAGDNRGESTDSDDFGPVKAAGVIGIAVLRLRPWPPEWLSADQERLR
jgi:nickel-type superoxide dismutase maturation protease